MNCPTRDHCEGHPDWNQNPPYLAPELTTRQSLVCGGKKDGRYDLPMHVLALFIILVVSTLACSFPLMVKKFPQLKVPHNFLFLSRHFGTGVLISTAFVHLLPTAFTSLTDPCLPEFWNQGYPAMAGLIAMIAVFFVVTIEMTFSTLNGASLGGCHGGHDRSTSLGGPLPGYQPVRIEEEVNQDGGAGVLNGYANGPAQAHFTVANGNDALSPIPGRKTRHRRSGSIAGELRRIERENISMDYLQTGEATTLPVIKAENSESDSDADGEAERLIVNGSPGPIHTPSLGNSPSSPIPTRSPRIRHQRSHSNASSHRHGGRVKLTEAQQQQKNLLQVLLLEAGILFHSVFIGMALSVATGSNFIVLLIAISFHQTFEGLALGSRIAAITAFPRKSPKPWLMTLAYGTTTPVGQAIGLITRNMYDPASQTGLLMVGVMNAISSGLLLFAGLVELLAEDFLSDESYMVLKGRKRVQAGLAVVAGAAGMALVGAWA